LLLFVVAIKMLVLLIVVILNLDVKIFLSPAMMVMSAPKIAATKSVDVLMYTIIVMIIMDVLKIGVTPLKDVNID
jgi:hypothetical protein